jgi:hypothetical protein
MSTGGSFPKGPIDSNTTQSNVQIEFPFPLAYELLKFCCTEDNQYGAQASRKQPDYWLALCSLRVKPDGNVHSADATVHSIRISEDLSGNTYGFN